MCYCMCRTGVPWPWPLPQPPSQPPCASQSSPPPKGGSQRQYWRHRAPYIPYTPQYSPRTRVGDRSTAELCTNEGRSPSMITSCRTQAALPEACLLQMGTRIPSWGLVLVARCARRLTRSDCCRVESRSLVPGGRQRQLCR